MSTINLKLAGELFMRLRHAATNAHVEHLTTTIFARHNALGSFYDDIVELADDFAEAAQGAANATRLEYDNVPFVFNPVVENWAGNLRAWIIQTPITDASELLNIIDEIKQRIDKLVDNLSRN